MGTPTVERQAPLPRDTHRWRRRLCHRDTHRCLCQGTSTVGCHGGCHGDTHRRAPLPGASARGHPPFASARAPLPGVVSRIDPPSVSRSIPDGSVGDLSRCATPWGRGARWPGGAHEPVPVDLEWSGSQFVEGVLHVLGVDGAGLGEGGGGQCVVRGAVDLPGQAPGVCHGTPTVGVCHGSAMGHPPSNAGASTMGTPTVERQAPLPWGHPPPRAAQWDTHDRAAGVQDPIPAAVDGAVVMLPTV